MNSLRTITIFAFIAVLAVILNASVCSDGQLATDVDIRIQSLNIPSEKLYAGDVVYFSVYVEKVGEQKVTFVVTVLINNVAIFENEVMKDMPPSTVKLDYNTTLSAGVHTISVVVDPRDSVKEYDETNNRVDQSFQVEERPVKTLPDLWLIDLDSDPEEVFVGDYTNIRGVVQNKGDASSGTTSIRLYIDGEYHDERDVQTLVPGQEKTFTFDWDAIEGRHEFKVEVDESDSIVEWDESNNHLIRVVMVSGEDQKPVEDIPVSVGVFRDESGDPMAGVIVKIVVDGKVHLFQSKNNGIATLDLPESMIGNTYAIEVRRDGYLDDTFNITIGDNGSSLNNDFTVKEDRPEDGDGEDTNYIGTFAIIGGLFLLVLAVVVFASRRAYREGEKDLESEPDRLRHGIKVTSGSSHRVSYRKAKSQMGAADDYRKDFSGSFKV